MTRSEMIDRIAEFQVNSMSVSDLQSIAFEYISDSMQDWTDNELLFQFEKLFQNEVKDQVK